MINPDLFLILGVLTLWYCFWSFLLSGKPTNTVQITETVEEEYSPPQAESVDFVLSPEALERLSGFVSFPDNFSKINISPPEELSKSYYSNVIILSNHRKIRDLSNV